LLRLADVQGLQHQANTNAASAIATASAFATASADHDKVKELLAVAVAPAAAAVAEVVITSEAFTMDGTSVTTSTQSMASEMTAHGETCSTSDSKGNHDSRVMLAAHQ